MHTRGLISKQQHGFLSKSRLINDWTINYESGCRQTVAHADFARRSTVYVIAYWL